MEFFTILLLFSSIPAVCFPRGGSALCSQVLPVRTPRPVRRFIALSALPAGAPGHPVLQRYELFGALTKVAAFAAGSSRWCYTTTPLPATALPRCPQPVAVLPRRPCQQQPHPAEKRTPVWLAIWRTWAGFANSQLRHATFPALIYIYASISIAATLEPLLRQTQIYRPICTDCLRHLRISAG